jgi:hypothetical protein
MKEVLALTLALLGCTERPAQRPSAHSTVPATPTDSVPVSSNPSELARPGALPIAVQATCDSAAKLVHEALALDLKREDGDFTDSFKGERRLGCRLTAEGSFATLKDSAGPVGAVAKAFTRRGWKGDLRYMADGPDGSDIGLRRLDQLCLVLGQWDGGDDNDETPAPATEADNTFRTIVECARDVASNQDAGVPDSIWRVPSKAGLDSLFAISVTIQSPPYLDGDFDGDGVTDGAVLVENRKTGKTGVAIVRRGAGRVTILGAGSGSAGPDDLSWIDRWDVFRNGTTYNLTIGDRPGIQLGADALWVGRQDSASAFYVWTGANYIWEFHSRAAGDSGARPATGVIMGQQLRHLP